LLVGGIIVGGTLQKTISISRIDDFYEDVNEVEEHSIYAPAYKKAKKLVYKIISEENATEERRKRRKIGILEKREINNIISFIGGRGTGKTSAMFSFMNYLNNSYRYHNTTKRDSYAKENIRSDVAFSCIDYIDGAY
jgi:hypothetical protein